MDFKLFKKNIFKLSKLPLGGLEAQFELAPKFREKYTEEFLDAIDSNLKKK